jgi:hypothetical protein
MRAAEKRSEPSAIKAAQQSVLCGVRQKTSHQTRFVLGEPSRNLLKKKAFAMMGANLGPAD